ncbi:MAG: tetratricopeptide repeat protein [Clostridium sp.]|nr:tetratricopeptide repeat protein [Clostridium sp.]
MDKYEFNIKVEQIKKMVARSDYETAMKIADTIDWRRVRNINILSMAATIYEKNEEYQEAKDILLLAFERAPIGKRLLYKLAELAIKEGSLREAEDYYREFCDLAPDDPRQYILRYLILGAKGAPTQQLIHTLEQYCNLELDEKWLYELAELYSEAGLDDLCIMTCDKIMLMFGLGKYVDKAMELKIQLAPLTKYQMDLVENRDKYEAKLKAVEQEYRMGAPVEYEEEDPGAEAYGYQEPVYKADAAYKPADAEDTGYTRQSAYAGEAAYTREPSYEEEAAYVREPAYEEEPDFNAREREAYFGEPEGEAREDIYEDEYQDGYREDYPDEYGDSDGKPDVYEDRYQDEAQYQERYEEEEASLSPELTIEPEEADDIPSSWIPEEPVSPPAISEEALKARIHEAEVQANLAMEMSRLSGGEGFSQELEMAQTRVLTDIKDMKIGGSAPVSCHIMIEAETQEQGLREAVDALKKIHKETGSKNQAAKITGEKLNLKGVFAVADKLTGKDLIVEQAGMMVENTLQELNQLIARDETGMNVVLIDTAAHLKELYRVYPGFAKQFELKKAERILAAEPDEDNRPVRHIEINRENTGMPVLSREAAEAKKDSLRTQRTVAENTAPRPAADRTAPQTAARQQELRPVVKRKEPQPVYQMESEPAARPKPAAARPGQPPVSSRKTVVSRIREEELPSTEIPSEPEEPEYENDQEEMDIDEFAKYACKYAGEIDCSISGKSMLALYERIEIMEEDGIPLIAGNAEDLIEEAADRAENPSFFKRLTGIFSSKYDKEGLLILKEEHFI